MHHVDGLQRPRMNLTRNGPAFLSRHRRHMPLHLPLQMKPRLPSNLALDRVPPSQRDSSLALGTWGRALVGYPQSYRSVVMGSIPAARRQGKYAAHAAAAITNTATVAYAMPSNLSNINISSCEART